MSDVEKKLGDMIAEALPPPRGRLLIIERPCHRCAGKGWRKKKLCPRCFGKGWTVREELEQ